MLLNQKIDVNHADKYNQTAIFYCVRQGDIKTTEQLIAGGADVDFVDKNNQTPIYYAIKNNRVEMVEFLISKNVKLDRLDNSKKTPLMYAKSNQKKQVEEVIAKHLNVGTETKVKEASQPSAVQPASKKQDPKKTNERRQTKKYLLTTLREGGYYEAMTEAEFEDFRQKHPEVAKCFEDSQSLQQLEVPDVSDQAPIYDHWEKVATRMLQSLGRNSSAWIFQEPVNYEQLKIPDYPLIVKKPMDFGTIKQKLKN